MEWIVDRIEGDYVVVESDGEFYDIPLALLPNITEGSIINLEVTDGYERQQQIKSKMSRLFNKGERHR